MIKKLLPLCSLAIGISFVTSSCSSSKSNNLPSQEQYEGYKIIDSVDRDTVNVKIDKEEKIAVVFRDISTTAYSFLEPRYNNSMVRFDAKSNCCNSDPQMMGNSGKIVYKFSFIGKGDTTINLVARHKGLSPTTKSFDDDRVYTINVHVD